MDYLIIFICYYLNFTFKINVNIFMIWNNLILVILCYDKLIKI